MSIKEMRARIRARVWQSLAQSELSLKDLPQEELTALVDTVTDAALMEIDNEITKTITAEQGGEVLAGGLGEEKVLWEGRPFLSINTHYVITDERVRLISGLLGKDREDIELIRIQDIDQSQSVGERLLNLGDIIIRSHDRSHPTVELRNVPEPQKVHEILRRAVLEARKKHGLYYREEM
jgi:hypothetical protein